MHLQVILVPSRKWAISPDKHTVAFACIKLKVRRQQCMENNRYYVPFTSGIRGLMSE